MKRPLVAGNWKMNGSRASIGALIDGLRAGLSPDMKGEIAVCPPYVYIPLVAEAIADLPIALGSQDVSDRESGAYTGEVGASMLRDYNCVYAIVGHSERRQLYGCSDAMVAAKIVQARASGLRPIACVGETLEERESGRTEAVIGRQLDAILDAGPVSALADSVIAYEPVWAIGTGRTATPDQAQEVHAFIRSRIAERSPEAASRIRILYGGSVNAANAAALFAMADVDGGLIGGASLKPEEFVEICRAAERRCGAE